MTIIYTILPDLTEWGSRRKTRLLSFWIFIWILFIHIFKDYTNIPAWDQLDSC